MTRPFYALCLVALTGACYRYVPLSNPAPEVGTELRSHLTPEGTTALATTLGRDVANFDGRLLSQEASVWRFAVTGTRTQEARAVSWTGEPVSVPRSAITRMELKVLDRPKSIRTAILATVGGIVIGLAVKGIAGSASGTPDGGGSPPPP